MNKYKQKQLQANREQINALIWRLMGKHIMFAHFCFAYPYQFFAVCVKEGLSGV